MSVKAFFDTNVLVYLFDQGSPAKQERAMDLLREYAGEAVLSTQVLQEFFVTVTRKLQAPLSEAEAEAAMQNLSALSIVPVNVDLIFRAVSRVREDRTSFWDGLIIEAAIESRASLLFSEDLQDGREFGSLRVVNPFRPAA